MIAIALGVIVLLAASARGSTFSKDVPHETSILKMEQKLDVVSNQEFITVAMKHGYVKRFKASNREAVISESVEVLHYRQKDVYFERLMHERDVYYALNQPKNLPLSLSPTYSSKGNSLPLRT